MNHLEARTWLKNNKNNHAFAGNRFLNNADSLYFVENLYQNGAVEVLVDNIFKEKWRFKECGGPYADTLIVKLPEDEVSREKIMEIFYDDNDLEPQFMEKVAELDDTIIFWWD